MIDHFVTTLGVICRQAHKIPMKHLQREAGYSKSGIEWHIRQLVGMGLVEKDGYWKPTFPGPYDHDTLRARVILHTAIQEAEGLPWLQDQLRTLVQGIGRPVVDVDRLRHLATSILDELDKPPIEPLQ